MKQIPEVIDALKGWPRDHALDFTSQYDPDSGTVMQGACIHVDPDDGEFVPGVGTLQVMPLFAIQPSSSYDVTDTASGDPASDKRPWVTVNPAGDAGALVATGGYELLSPAYSGVDADFPPNTPLTAALSGADKGLLVPGIIGTDMICGIVSRGLIDDGHGGTALAFWTHPIFPV